MVLVLALIAGVTGFVFRDDIYRVTAGPAPIEYPKNPTFATPDGKVMITAPTRLPGLDHSYDFSIEPKPKSVASVKQSRLPLKAISTPVDIKPTKGTPPADKLAVTLKYDKKQIPKGLTSDQVGMAVLDTNMGTWVPILNAKADAATSTVTALAPHFSEYMAFVLDPAKRFVEAAGKKIETTINAGVTVAQWFSNFVTSLTDELIKDLFGKMDPLSCKPQSERITTKAVSPFDMLQACAKPSGKNDTLMLGNGFAFPLLSEPLPAGVTLTEGDISNNGGDIANSIRSSFWAKQNRVYVNGASHGSVTVQSSMKSTADVKLWLDDEAIAFDVGLAVLSVIAPSKEVAASAVKSGIAAIAKGESIVNLPVDGAAWLNTTYGVMDCIVAGGHDSKPEKMFEQEGYEYAATLAHDCLGAAFDKLNLKGALTIILENLKLIPEVLSSAAYLAADALTYDLPSQFSDLKMLHPAVTVTRKGSNPKPTQKEEPKQPTDTGETDIAGYVGTWYSQNNFLIRFPAHNKLVIRKDLTGTYTSHTGCEAAEDQKWKTCTVKVGVDFSRGTNGSLVGIWQQPVVTYDDPSWTQPSDLLMMQPGGVFKLLYKPGKEHTLYVVEEAVPVRIGNPNLCDKDIGKSSKDC